MVEIKDEEFKQLADLIKSHYGIYLKIGKQSLISGRLQNLLEQKEIQNFSEYYNYLMLDKTGTAEIEFIDKITTNHTYFMRENEHFEYFFRTLLPNFEKSIADNDLRIWSAGCSTGEEPIALAILINEFFGVGKYKWDTKILATDISNRVLEIARKGIYSNESLTPLPTHWIGQYFKKVDDENSVLVDKIKNEIIYRNFNLMSEIFPFKRKFHIIFCRNVMIYFDNKTKIDLVNKFYDSIEYGGYLFIGHSEALNREETKFKYIMPSLYRKI